MSPDFRKVALIAATLGLLVSLFVALRPAEDETRAAPKTTQASTQTEPTLEPIPGTTEETETEPPPATTAPDPNAPVTIRVVVPSDSVPEVRRFSVRRGRVVELVVRTELTDHVHLHGYDLMADVGPGRPGRIRFTADAPGRFEIELEGRALHIAELEVRP